MLCDSERKDSTPSLSTVPCSSETTMLDTWNLCSESLARAENGHRGNFNSNKIPVPPPEVIQFLRVFCRPDVQNFFKKMADHFEFADCQHNGNDCFEVHESDDWSTVPQTQHFQTQSQSPQFAQLQTPRQQLLAVESVEYDNMDMNEPIQTVVTATVTEPIQTVETATVATLRRSPRKQLYQTTDTCTQPTPASSSCVSTMSTGESHIPPSEMAGSDKETLLKSYPSVLESEALKLALKAARKSGRPGYTLCYNLLVGVFSTQVIAVSRGQGLVKPKEGDLRPPLYKTRITAIKSTCI